MFPSDWNQRKTETRIYETDVNEFGGYLFCKGPVSNSSQDARLQNLDTAQERLSPSRESWISPATTDQVPTVDVCNTFRAIFHAKTPKGFIRLLAFTSRDDASQPPISNSVDMLPQPGWLSSSGLITSPMKTLASELLEWNCCVPTM